MEWFHNKTSGWCFENVDTCTLNAICDESLWNVDQEEGQAPYHISHNTGVCEWNVCFVDQDEGQVPYHIPHNTGVCGWNVCFFCICCWMFLSIHFYQEMKGCSIMYCKY